MPPRLPVLIRQTQVFELVVAGKTYAEICKQLGVSEDTVARDMRAVAEQVQQLVRERADEILAVAIAQIAEVRAAAQREYEEARRLERAWHAGKFDFDQIETKTLAVEEDTELRDESLPVEVKRRRVRPPMRGGDRAQYLMIMRQCALDLVELCGVKRIMAAPATDGTLTIEVVYGDG